MTTLNETLTLGLVLVLLFGSICLYLYTRIQQNEQKLNLVESILIDLKMTTEVKSYPDLPAPMPYNAAPVESVPMTVEVTMKPMPEDVAPTVVEINEVATSSEAIPLTESTSLQEQFASEDAHIETGSVKVGANYTSMTQTELRALAKQRHISGASGMRRQQLIEALQTSDRAEESGAPAPMEPFLGGEGTNVVSIPA
jgi:hypothetical protein